MSNPVPRLKRLLSIIPLIQRREGITLQELQETLGVSKRELQGDLNAIMLCGVPPYLPNDYISVFIDGDQVTVEYADHFARPARLTLREALALRLALERLPIAEDGPLYDDYLELLEALDHLMRKEGRMAALEGRIEAPKTQGMGDKLAVIDAAIAARRPLDLIYFSASSNAVSARRVRPYGRGNKFGNDYVVAYCEKKAAVLSFRLDRISSIHPAEGAEPFAVPGDFDLDEHMDRLGPKGGFTVRLRFDAAIAHFAAEDYAEMKVEKAPGGDVVVELTCHSLPWAARQALLYGELCEVLEPPEARDELVTRLKAYLGE